MKIRKFGVSKDNTKKMKDNLQNKKNVSASHYMTMDFYPEYIKNVYNLTIKRQITQLKYGQSICTGIS